MEEPSSLTINPFPATNSVSFQGVIPTLPSYSVRAMYCDPSWEPSNPTCDVDIQDYCGSQTSAIDMGNGVTKTIHAMLDTLHPCGIWYSSIMTEFSTYYFTQRNIDIVGKIINLYCAENGQASKNGDTQSCQCLNAFYADGSFYTPDAQNAGKAFPVVGSASQTDRDILFTDPVCGNVVCPSDPSVFAIPNLIPGVHATLSTLVLPDIILEKRHCPQNICASILGNQSVDINNFNGGTELNILDFTNTCYITNTNGISVTRTISSNYTYSVQARDDSPPLCGRWQYDAQSKQILAESGAAGFNLLFSVYGATDNPQIANLYYSISGYNSPYFEFTIPAGTLTGVQNSYTSQLLLQVHPNGILPPFDGKSFYQDSYPATILTSQSGDTLSQQKQIQVSILIYPDTPAPQTPSNIEPTKPLPQKSAISWSRSSLALAALCVILLAYALGFFLEMIQIRNLVTSVKDLIPK
jgi:hypothetical protein